MSPLEHHRANPPLSRNLQATLGISNISTGTNRQVFAAPLHWVFPVAGRCPSILTSQQDVQSFVYNRRWGSFPLLLLQTSANMACGAMPLEQVPPFRKRCSYLAMPPHRTPQSPRSRGKQANLSFTYTLSASLEEQFPSPCWRVQRQRTLPNNRILVLVLHISCQRDCQKLTILHLDPRTPIYHMP